MANNFIPRAGAVIGAAGLLILGSAAPSLADVGQDQAGKIVTDMYGGQVISVESDSEQGQPTWEVEVANSSQYGRIEVDVAKSSGQIITCEAEDQEGSCPAGVADGDVDGDGDVDDNDNDGDVDGDDAAMAPGSDMDGDDAAMAPGGAQVAPMPSGGADTGVAQPVKSNDGILAGGSGLALAGGAGLAIAGSAGLIWMRRQGETN